MKIIHITDTHLMPAGETLYTLDPAARLKRVLDDVKLRHADADLLVLTGDLTQDGNPAAYRLLETLLTDMPFPVRLLLGNHDDRANFHAAFPAHPVDSHGFVQSMMAVPEAQDRLLFLDSNSACEVGGRFCGQRAAWLRDTLSTCPDSPLMVFIHHPPVAHGMAHFNNIGLHDTETLMEILRAHVGGVRHIFFGHIHIPLTGTTHDGIGFTAGRGCTHQFRQDFNNPAPDWVAGVPNYGVITLTAAQISYHVVDTLDAETLVPANVCAGP
ncbi:phosphodiesterase [Celeribacter halophilus]|uniref:3',5'-cyclic AMP phosphodiesterase CpdA n=1 Tax=Celeribacter halophilus TaxID=576117 RepID=A0A1I3MNH4_9RHOB|nr:phosphodiesterase [Celeribacter halophilus]PZX15452.1 3',5'-cyclic AMP phosphodiesterase CpdA [Celeribacter halophilus]SFI98533.1 3',5'-cyclic AMP phosphodiesterase CpdA [Celeribacter halophilus]